VTGVLLDDLLVAEDLAAAETTSSALHAASVAASSPAPPASPANMSRQHEGGVPVDDADTSLMDRSVVMASPVAAPLEGDGTMDISTENALSHEHRYVKETCLYCLEEVWVLGS
jgi:hypothetical protein